MPSPGLRREKLAYENPLHIRCGDDIRQTLDETGLPGTFLSWCDPVCAGPLPASDWYRGRAEFLAGDNPSEIKEIENELRQKDQLLETFRDHDAVILWFEHDLFDQAILMRLLDWFSNQGQGNIDLRIAGTDAYPGIERFIGLGQLQAQDLLHLYESSVKIGRTELEIGREAWNAWTAPTPVDLANLAKRDSAANLPYLQNAIKRQLEELPETESDLNTTETLILQALGENETTAGRLFVAVQQKEKHPWRGDTMFYAELERLSEQPTPLVVVSKKPVDRETRIQSAGQSKQVQDNWIQRQGINRWVAGTHLTKQNLWRWNKATQTLHKPA